MQQRPRHKRAILTKSLTPIERHHWRRGAERGKMAPSLVRGHADDAGTARFAGMRATAGTVEFEAAAAIFRIANPGGNPGSQSGQHQPAQYGRPRRAAKKSCNVAVRHNPAF
ncbi:hypothetical protein KZ686_13320 [Cupriavidus cauae]|uniref:hypothetical protein n=1 Tax=Cupriavidus cauae TaxID=2608999 RepID=UPI002242D2CA|nr:hypothetical protein [Cupriavidus cauae]UZN48723.1 hypothetical protein KZ686_13320 [Cupriavidus cauae]